MPEPAGGKLLLGLVGAGIQRSLSPALHEQAGREAGLRIHYQLVDTDIAGVGVERLAALLDAARIFGFRGLNVTYPFKQAVLPLLDRVSDEAHAIGAVNTVVREQGRWVGYNTDGSGWAWGMRRALPDADLSNVVLVGAGGAGSACADALLRLGARRLAVCDRDGARARALVQRLNAHFAGARAQPVDDLREALDGASGLVHATPTGMSRHPGMAFPGSWLYARIWVSEVVYVPLDTPLLAAARAAGCRTMDGGHMAVGQAAHCFERFTGRPADIERMDAHLRALVRRDDAPGRAAGGR